MLLLNYIKYLNKKRILFFRKLKYKKYDLTYKKKKPFPNLIKKVLLIDSCGMLGDSLYISGLAKALNESNISVTISTPKNSFFRYVNNQYIDELFDLNSINEVVKIKKYQPDVIVDLTYAKNREFLSRIELIKSLDVYCVCTSEYLKDLNIYNDFISFKECNHFSEYMGKVYKYLTNNLKQIYPYIKIEENYLLSADTFLNKINPKKYLKLIYFNTISRTVDRNLSLKQIYAVIELLSKKNILCIIYTNDLFWQKIIQKYDKNIIRVPQIPFEVACAIISKVDGVITTDTSVTHIASCFNCPTLTFFKGNCLDYFKNHLMKEIWHSISDVHIECYLNSPDFYVDKFGYQNKVQTDISLIPIPIIINTVSDFESCLLSNYSKI